MPKLKAMMDDLRRRGADVRILCIDRLLADNHRSKEAIRESGYPFVELEDPGFERNRHWLIQALQRRRLARSIRSLLDGLRIDAIVLGADAGVGVRTLIQVARGRGIRTVLVPDGLVLPRNPNFRARASIRLRAPLWRVARKSVGLGPRGSSGVDLILAMNRVGKEVFVEQGLPADRVEVVGSPEYDAEFRRYRQEHVSATADQISARLGLPTGRPVVLFAHQSVIDSARELPPLLTVMLEAVCECDATLLVKFHPRLRNLPEIDSWLTETRREDGSVKRFALVRDECSSLEAVRACAACVTAYSTVALEACLFRKPLVLIHYLNVPYRLPYGRQYGAAIEANDPDTLRAGIIAAVSDEATRTRVCQNMGRLIEHELCGLDGQSGERTARAIARLCSCRSTQSRRTDDGAASSKP